jgi:hypothetical protein
LTILSAFFFVTWRWEEANDSWEMAKIGTTRQGVVAFSQEAITGEMGKSVHLQKKNAPNLFAANRSQSTLVWTCTIHPLQQQAGQHPTTMELVE